MAQSKNTHTNKQTDATDMEFVSIPGTSLTVSRTASALGRSDLSNSWSLSAFIAFGRSLGRKWLGEGVA